MGRAKRNPSSAHYRPPHDESRKRLNPSYTCCRNSARGWRKFRLCAMQVGKKGSAAALDGDPFAADGGMTARLDAGTGDLARFDFAERDRLNEVPRLAEGTRH